MISENARNYENVVIRNEQEVGINNFGLDYMVGLEEEIERLNNIINELNDYLVNNINNGSLDFLYRQGFKGCYEKLQELKESDLAIPPEVIGTNGEDGGLFDYGDR